MIAREALDRADLPGTLPNASSVIQLEDQAAVQSVNGFDSVVDAKQLRRIKPTPNAGVGLRTGYRKEAFQEWLGRDTKFALLQSDFHIFGLLRSAPHLEDVPRKLGRLAMPDRVLARL